MREVVMTLTQRGQVTIPAEIWRLLRIHPGDQIVFVIADGGVRIERPGYKLEDTFGSVKPLPGTEWTDFDEQIQDAKEERAEQTIRRMFGP